MYLFDENEKIVTFTQKWTSLTCYEYMKAFDIFSDQI